MARTTIDLDPAILRELRRRGAREGKSMAHQGDEVGVRDIIAARSIADGRPEDRPEAVELAGCPNVRELLEATSYAAPRTQPPTSDELTGRDEP